MDEQAKEQESKLEGERNDVPSDRPYMELYLRSAILDPNSGKRKITMLSTKLADWHWSPDNPFVLIVVLYLDHARTKCDVRQVPASNVAEIRIPNAVINKAPRIVRPPSNLVIPKH